MSPPTQRFEERLTADYGYFLEAVLLHEEHSPYQYIQILDSATFGHALRLDGALQCSERDEYLYHEPLVHVPLAHVHERQRVLIIGGGDGGAAEEALKWPDVQRVDHVEIDERVVECSRRFLHGIHGGVFDGGDMRHRLHIADGLDWVAQQPDDAYDVIILDLTDERGPSSPLYAGAFLDQCRRVLALHGALSLHVAAPWAQPQTLARLLGRLAGVFAQVTPYVTAIPMSGGQWAMALCAPTPLVEPTARLPRGLRLVDADYLGRVGRLPADVRAADATEAPST